MTKIVQRAQIAQQRVVQAVRELTERTEAVHSALMKAVSPCHCRKNTFSLKPAQLNFFLPGAGYTEDDLLRVQRLADDSADQSLLELAWEVCMQPLCVRGL